MPINTINRLIVKNGSTTVATLTDANIYGGVNFSCNCNPDADLTVGTCACGQITFDTDILTPSAIGYTIYYYSKMLTTSAASISGLYGVFTITDAKKNKDKYTITAYDNILKFENTIVDDFISDYDFTDPTKNTLGAFFGALCTYCGCNSASTTFNNSDETIRDNFTTTNINGRTILGYIAQMAGCMAICQPNGYIEIKGYTSPLASGYPTIDHHDYAELEYEDYTAPAITKVEVASDDNQGTIPVSEGSGDSVLRIIANPLLIANSSSEIENAVKGIHYIVSDYSYTPMTVNLIYNPFNNQIRVGDIILVDNMYCYIMEINSSASGTEIKSVGQKTRSVGGSSIQGSINALRGRYTQITTDLGNLTVRVGDAEGDIAQLEVDVQGIESEVESKTSIYEQSTAPTSPSEGDLWHITSPAPSGYTLGRYYRWNGTEWVLSEDSQIYTNTSNITQNSNKIALVVTSSGGTDEVNAASIVTSINNTEGSSLVQIDADHIELDGDVVMKSDLTDGVTEISGDNIKTGTITANRIDLGTSVGYANCDSDLKSRIDSGGYSDADVEDLLDRAYSITATSLDASRIESPEIVGGMIVGTTLIAGTTSDGYTEADSTGLKIYTQVGSKPIIREGYIQGNYDYPFITMGHGVDSAGTDTGMIKKYANGMWIGDNDGMNSNTVGSGDGLFVNFNDHQLYWYENGTIHQLGASTVAVTAVFA